MVAVYRVGLKTKPHLKKLRLADFFIMNNGLAWSFVLLVSWVVGKLPKTVCKGWMEYATPALQVVIVPYQLGEHKRVRNRMNSSKRFTVRYIGRLPLLA